MGVGSRTFQTFLCDACGKEVIAEEGASVDGFYIEVLQVKNGKQVGTENVYACSDMCLETAIRDALKREALPIPAKLSATQELWLKGRKFNTPIAGLPIVDVKDETRVIGTAHEIASYQPSPVKRREPEDPLDPEWKPEFRGKGER